ncbi:MAG: hypothetical protein Q8M97_04060 [Methanobacteriaceae archaeon]|nr:hypothetical protein [Methanobacteriaceae archaeon]
MIIICEPQFKGHEHSQFNAALITVVKNAFPNKEILFLAEKEHIFHVQEILKKNSVNIKFKYKTIKVIPQNRVDPVRFPFEFILFNKIFKLGKQLNSERIIISNIRRPSIVSLKILMKKYNDLKIIVVLHGILESIYNSPFKITEFPFWFRFWILFGNNNQLRYMVLGSSIEKELVKELPTLKKYIISIDHPYFFSEKKHIQYSKENNIIKFGFFGFGSIRKGIDIFFKLAEDISNEKTRYNPEFILIGNLQNQKFGPVTYKKIDKIKNSAVFIPSNKKSLSLDEFESYANILDYSIILHKPQENRLTAMASLFDAISYLKPIIAINSPFVSYYFNKMGNIGYLCEDYNELKELILKILNNDHSKEYDQQIDNILDNRKKISIKVISDELAKKW